MRVWAMLLVLGSVALPATAAETCDPKFEALNYLKACQSSCSEDCQGFIPSLLIHLGDYFERCQPGFSYNRECLEAAEKHNFGNWQIASLCSKAGKGIGNCIESALQAGFPEKDVVSLCKNNNEWTGGCILVSHKFLLDDVQKISDLCSKTNEDTVNCVEVAIKRDMKPEQLFKLCGAR